MIDPFCGTGTTLVAAKILSKSYIGIDISQDYVDYSISRLDNHINEKSRVIEEINKHFVEMTFKERKEKGMWNKKLKIQQSNSLW